MSVRQCVSLLALASLLLVQLASAESDPAAACAENCRFVVVPSLGPAGPRGLNGTKGEKGDRGDAATLDTSQTYLDVKFEKADLFLSKVRDSTISGGYTTNSEFWDGVTYNVVMRMKTEIGFPSDITPDALNPETKIYHPFITHGVLSGATKIEDGATLDRPAIDSPQITGATNIGEGATILRPNITNPIIIGGASIESANMFGITEIARAQIAAGTIDGVTVTRSEIASSTLDAAQLTGATIIGEGATLAKPQINAPTLLAPNITGSISGQSRFVMGVLGAHTAPQSSCNMTSNSTGYLTIASNNGCLFSERWVDVGTLIHWRDGTASVITRWFNNKNAQTIPVGSNAHIERPYQICSMYYSSSMFSASQSHTTMKAPAMYDDTAGVVLSFAPMKPLSMATWSFPKIDGSNRPSDTLVGEKSVQTLTNKKFDRIAGDGTAVAVSVIKDTAAGIDLAPGVAGTNASVWLEPGSNAVAGLISVRVGSNPAVRGAVAQVVLGGSQSIPAFVTITPAIPEAALITTTFATGATQRQFWLGVETQLTPGVKYQWYYHVFG
jgi:hypothetical protein